MIQYSPSGRVRLIPGFAEKYGFPMLYSEFSLRLYPSRIMPLKPIHANTSGEKKIYLLKPRGFCAGVVRAIDVVKIALNLYGPPVYVRKEIVHNKHVVDELREMGAIFVEELEEVPNGGRAIFSAHGVSPEVRRQGKERNLAIIDATCPLVTKVHLEAVKFAREGYTIVLSAIRTTMRLSERWVRRRRA